MSEKTVSPAVLQEMRARARADWRALARKDKERGRRTWEPRDAETAIPQTGVLTHREIVNVYCEAYDG